MLRRNRSLVMPAFALATIGSLAASCGSEESGYVPTPESVSFMRSAVQGGYVDSTDTGVVGILIDLGQEQAGCTGSLLAPNVVLTARHCVASLPTQQIVCGTTNFGATYAASSLYVFNDTTLGSQTFMYSVKEVRVPTASGMCGNDVAMLILNQNFVPTKAKFLTPSFEAPYGGLGYSAAGYGLSCPTCQDSETRRRRDSLQVQCVGSCQQPSYADNKEWWGDDGVCSGDSGGPALDPQGRVIGVASRAGASNGLCVGALYERVDSWKDLIVKAAVDGAALGGYPAPSWTGAGTGGSGGAPQTCDVCSNQSIVPGMPCETAWANCTGAQTCIDYLNCLDKCAANDSSCSLACYNNNLAGAHLYGAVGDCICGPGCAGPCATECTPPQCGWTWTDKCGTCSKASCCSESQACADHQDCVDHVYCIDPCTTQACVTSCASKHQPGAAVYNTWMDCLESKCATDCGFNTGGSGGAAGSGGAGGTAGQGGGSAGQGGGSAGQGGGTAGQGGGTAGQGGGTSGQAGASNAGEGGAPGAGGAAEIGGAPQFDNDAGATSLVTEDPAGCGCSTPGQRRPLSSALLLLAGAVVALRPGRLRRRAT